MEKEKASITIRGGVEQRGLILVAELTSSGESQKKNQFFFQFDLFLFQQGAG